MLWLYWKLSKVADTAKGNDHGRLDVAHSDGGVLYVDIRLAAFRRVPFGAGRQVLRPVHGRCAVQLSVAGQHHHALALKSRDCNLGVQKHVIPRLHDQAIIKRTSYKHQTNIEQLEHTSCTCILDAFAGCLLDDCSMFAWSCKRGITHFNISLNAKCARYVHFGEPGISWYLRVNYELCRGDSRPTSLVTIMGWLAFKVKRLKVKVPAERTYKTLKSSFNPLA